MIVARLEGPSLPEKAVFLNVRYPPPPRVVYVLWERPEACGWMVEGEARDPVRYLVFELIDHPSCLPQYREVRAEP